MQIIFVFDQKLNSVTIQCLKENNDLQEVSDFFKARKLIHDNCPNCEWVDVGIVTELLNQKQEWIYDLLLAPEAYQLQGSNFRFIISFEYENKLLVDTTGFVNFQ